MKKSLQGRTGFTKRVQLLFLCLALGLCVKASKADSIAVYVFLSETCPICQSITTELKTLHEFYEPYGIEFTGLFPNAGLSTETTMKKFARKYGLSFTLKSDGEHVLVKQLDATTTPQVFVVRKSDGKVLYSGKIDNSFEAIGKKRNVVTEHYLQNALENILHNKPIQPAQTKPVGCFISQL
jgi:peroxiredoxin